MALLTNKIAIVTGGARGIGEASARKLAENGAKVILADLDFEGVKKVADDICKNGEEAFPLKLNVSDFEEARKKVDEIYDKFGHIDILVNIAGVTDSKPIENITYDSWDRVMNIDLKAMFFLTQSVFVKMKKQNYGKLVHMSSLAALRGGRSSDASYASAKAGVLNLSKCFALHGAPFNITSNAICPGNILTPMAKELSWSKIDPKTYIPLGRYGTVEDVANSVLFYSSSMSDYITGGYINISGGLYM